MPLKKVFTWWNFVVLSAAVTDTVTKSRLRKIGIASAYRVQSIIKGSRGRSLRREPKGRT